VVAEGISMNREVIATAILSASLLSCHSLNVPTDNASLALPHSSVDNPDRRNTLSNGLIDSPPRRTELSPAEQELYNLIMRYRKEKSLPEIPISKSLSLVAKLHVRDLETHPVPAPYNFHSWSKDGPWKSVNYTPDHRYAKLMWDKPREVAQYNGNGYEIAYMHSVSATPEAAFYGWKSSGSHSSVILNESDWQRIKWKAIGIGIFGRYAAVWFGEEPDPGT
jgi:uncharacterized protein YkwD